MEQPRPNRDAEPTHLIRSRGGPSDPRETWCAAMNCRIEAECIADTTCIPCLRAVMAAPQRRVDTVAAARNRIDQLTRDGLAALDRGALHTASGSALDTLATLAGVPRRGADADTIVARTAALQTVPPSPRCSFVPAEGLAAIVLAKARGGTTSGDIRALRDRFGCKAVSTHEILGMSDPLAGDALEDNGDPEPRRCCADHVGHVLSDRDGWVCPIGFDPFVSDPEPPGPDENPLRRLADDLGVSIVPGGIARDGFGSPMLLSSLPGPPGWFSDIDDGMMQHARQAGEAIAASPVAVSGGPDITAAAMHLARHSTMTYQQAHAVMTRFVALPSDVRFALSGFGLITPRVHYVTSEADEQAMIDRCIAREAAAFGGPPITPRDAGFRQENSGPSASDIASARSSGFRQVTVRPRPSTSAGPSPGTSAPCRAPGETDESLRARIHAWMYRLEPEPSVPASEHGARVADMIGSMQPGQMPKLPTEHTVILRNARRGTAFLKCYDPTITRLDDGRGEIRLTTTCASHYVLAMREQYALLETFEVEAGTEFSSDCARFETLNVRDGGCDTHIVTMKIKALNVQPAAGAVVAGR